MGDALSALRTIARTTGAFALAATVVGAVHATLTIWPRTWVLEFQAGPASGVGEKLAAIVQSTAIEGFGFLGVGLVLALAAFVLVRIVPRLRDVGRSDVGRSDVSRSDVGQGDGRKNDDQTSDNDGAFVVTIRVVRGRR